MMTHIFFSQNLFIKSVLAIGTLYSLIFCFFKVVYGIVFVVTPDIKIISFGVRRLKNMRVTPNREEILSVYHIQHCFTCRPSDSTVSEDAGIEPGLLRLRRWQSDALTTRVLLQ
jgi:hypothetical protein